MTMQHCKFESYLRVLAFFAVFFNRVEEIFHFSDHLLSHDVCDQITGIKFWNLPFVPKIWEQNFGVYRLFPNYGNKIK